MSEAQGGRHEVDGVEVHDAPAGGVVFEGLLGGATRLKNYLSNAASVALWAFRRVKDHR